MKMIIPVLIILTGLGIIVYPYAKEKYEDYKGNQAIAELEKQLDNGDDDINIELTDNDEGNASNLTLGTQEPDVPSTVDGSTPALGLLYIDKLNLKLAIIEGVTNQALNGTIAGHEPKTSLPNKAGNCALASHRSLTYGRNFNRLNEMKIGDKIKIRTKEGYINYTVFKKYIVLRTDTSPLAQPTDPKERMVTLITCDPIGAANPQNRLIVQCKAD